MDNYFGKYRGIVIDNNDSHENINPENGAATKISRGRIQVRVPSVLGNNSFWATPCVPYAGKNQGLILLPPIGANVWVEFEEGDIDYPIWSGCFWGENEFPEILSPNLKLFKTANLNLQLDDINNTFAIQSNSTENPNSFKLIMKNDNEISLILNEIIINIQQNKIELSNESQKIEIDAPSLSIIAKMDFNLAGESVNINNDALVIT